MPELTAERVRELLHYDPETGVLTWACDGYHNTYRAGEVAGRLAASGYVIVKVAQRRYRAHRVAWALHYGKWPDYEIDHINGVRTDNRIENLRDVPRQVNAQNIVRSKVTVKNPYQGITPGKRSWTAQISFKGRTHRIGSFPTAEEAHQAYLAAKRRLHEGCTI